MQMRLAPSVSLLALAVASCAPNPRLAVAPAVAAGEWREAGSSGLTPLESSWAAFGSAELDALIARARAANADVSAAVARVVQARGELGVARARTLPSLTAAADDHDAGVDVAYDVDLFGSGRAGKRAARARLAASAYDRDAVTLAVESDVARAVIQHAALSTRSELLAQALANARELDRIIGVRVREGAATRVDSGLQRIEVRRIEAEVSRIAEARARTRNALAILVGEEAPSFASPVATLLAFKAPSFDATQPGALLVRRPDVRAAEARIAAADGDVDRARTAFLPSLRISAGSLLGAGSGPLGLGFSAGSSLLAPIFAGGRLKGDLLTATGAQRESVERYRKALLVALGETEDALTGIAEAGRRESLLRDTMAVARTTARLARRQYIEGAADLQTVLDAERGALDIEDAHAVALQDRLDAAVDLYRALGGSPAGSARA